MMGAASESCLNFSKSEGYDKSKGTNGGSL